MDTMSNALFINSNSDSSTRKSSLPRRRAKSFIFPENGHSPIHNKSLPTLNGQSDSSPYKFNSVLSFDAYGNLTVDDSDAKYSHEVPSLEEFDDIISSFEGKLKKEYSKDSVKSKNKIKKTEKKRSYNKRQTPTKEADYIDIIKNEFDCSSTVTSRYGRARKVKSQDGFFFGTVDVNSLRKISKNSKPHSTSFSETKIDSDQNMTNGSVELSKSIENISSNILDYSSEDEFSNSFSKVTHAKRKVKRFKSLPLNLKKMEPENQTRNKKRKNCSPEKKVKKKYTKRKSSPIQKPYSDSKIKKNPLKKKDQPITENNISSNDEKDEELALLKEMNIGTIQEDINIIKGSLSTNVISKASRFSPLKELPDAIMADSTDDESKSPETKKVIEIKKEPADPANDTQQTPVTDNGLIPNEESVTTKFGRHIKKPDLIDLSTEFARRKSVDKSLKIESENANAHPLDILDAKQLEKLYPRIYFIGDIVWAALKGNPLWPALVTYPYGETDYTRIVNIQGSVCKRHRIYHVQFFYDNFKTTWVPTTRLFKYEGLDKLKDLVDQEKSSKETSSKNLMKCFFKISTFIKRENIKSKSQQWHEALAEADKGLALDRYQRVEMFMPAEVTETKIKPGEAEAVPPIKKKYDRLKKLFDDDTDSVKNGRSSSDEFSGFDENSTLESKNLKSKLDKFNTKRRNYKDGDFNVYLQKHLSASVNDLHMSEDRATKLLRKRWDKLTPLQRSRYRPKIEFACFNSESSSSESSNSPAPRLKKATNKDGVDIAKGTYRIPRQEKVCFKCEDVSGNGSSDMVRCKGVCGGCFHLRCVGLTSLPKNDFKCAFCLSGVHNCFVCKSSEGERLKCSVTSCGKFYHAKCLGVWPQASKARISEKLVCPRHLCHMCAAYADDMNDPVAKTSPFTRCLRCPTSYHTEETCIAAGSNEITQSYHICTKHMDVPKNNNHHFNVNWCFCCSKGGSLLLCDQCPAAFHAECLNITAPEGSYVCEDCVNGKYPVCGDIVWVKLGAYRWWPGEVLHSRHIPDNIERLPHSHGMFCVHFFGSDDYYWVSRGRTFHYQEGDQGSKYSSSKFLQQKFQKALSEALVAFRKQKERRDLQEKSLSQKGSLKPAPFVKIDTNKPVGNVKVGKMDVSTVNKCDCDPYMENPCSSDEKCINRMLMVECVKEVCSAKERCNNQRFQRRQYPNVLPFKTLRRGWGLKTNDFIRKGEFVIEYVGELIDDAEFKRRIDQMHEYKEENYYFLTVEPDRIIDAGPKGNLARFMNHCCQPNCETQKWTVGAETRVGLFALEDIPEGSEVTFNYNLLCVGTDKKKCNCEAPNCSGFIGAKVQKPESLPTKKDAPKKKKNKKKRVEKDWENDCFRCFKPGNLILCDVSSCPKGYHLECLGLDALPKGKWLCPWHHCDECGSRSCGRCVLCPNSFCKNHLTDKFHADPQFADVCLEHGPDELEAHRGQKEAIAKSLKEKNLQKATDDVPKKCSEENSLSTNNVPSTSSVEVKGDMPKNTKKPVVVHSIKKNKLSTHKGNQKSSKNLKMSKVNRPHVKCNVAAYPKQKTSKALSIQSKIKPRGNDERKKDSAKYTVIKKAKLSAKNKLKQDFTKNKQNKKAKNKLKQDFTKNKQNKKVKNKLKQDCSKKKQNKKAKNKLKQDCSKINLNKKAKLPNSNNRMKDSVKTTQNKIPSKRESFTANSTGIDKEKPSSGSQSKKSVTNTHKNSRRSSNYRRTITPAVEGLVGTIKSEVSVELDHLSVLHSEINVTSTTETTASDTFTYKEKLLANSQSKNASKSSKTSKANHRCKIVPTDIKPGGTKESELSVELDHKQVPPTVIESLKSTQKKANDASIDNDKPSTVSQSKNSLNTKTKSSKRTSNRLNSFALSNEKPEKISKSEIFVELDGKQPSDSVIESVSTDQKTASAASINSGLSSTAEPSENSANITPKGSKVSNRRGKITPSTEYSEITIKAELSVELNRKQVPDSVIESAIENQKMSEPFTPCSQINSDHVQKHNPGSNDTVKRLMPIMQQPQADVEEDYEEPIRKRLRRSSIVPLKPLNEVPRGGTLNNCNEASTKNTTSVNCGMTIEANAKFNASHRMNFVENTDNNGTGYSSGPAKDEISSELRENKRSISEAPTNISKVLRSSINIESTVPSPSIGEAKINRRRSLRTAASKENQNHSA